MRPASCAVIDIGGTSVKAAVAEASNKGVKLGEVLVLPVVDNTIERLMDTVVVAISKTTGQETLDGIGIATTGSVRSDGLVVNAPFFSGYRNHNWQNALETFFPGRQVSVLNDGQAGALGSYVEEFSATHNSLAFFVIGTGIGGGYVLDGKLVRGSHGFAGTFGHVKILESGDDVCVCGRKGCVENVGSGRAIAAMALGRPVTAEEVRGGVAQARSRLLQGDPEAIAIFKRAGRALGRAIGDIANVLDPSVVVISGGIVRAAENNGGENVYLVAARKEALEVCTVRIAQHLEVKRCELEYPNLVGAAVATFVKLGEPAYL